MKIGLKSAMIQTKLLNYEIPINHLLNYYYSFFFNTRSDFFVVFENSFLDHRNFIAYFLSIYSIQRKNQALNVRIVCIYVY